MATTKAHLLVVWALVAADLFGTGLARASVAALGKEQREFDYFALALQWPGTICASTRHCCAINGCCREEPLQTFTIHGLWPDYDDGTWPSCCRHTSFDMDKEMLATGDIFISNANEYALTDVISTITQAFGGSPQIICKKGSVSELRLCFTKDLKPRDCLTTSGMYKSLSKSSCPRYISLPAYDPIVLTNSTVEILTEASNGGMYFYTS